MKLSLFLAILLAAALSTAPLRAAEAVDAAAAEAPSFALGKEGIYLGAGFFFQNVLKVSGGDSGGRGLLGEAYFPELMVGYRFGRWFPLLGITPFGNRMGEGNKRRGTLRLQMPILLPAAEGSAWELKAGPGVLLHRIYGDGGWAELGNGGGSKLYYTPPGTSTTRLFYVTGGAAYLNEDWRYDVDLIITGLLTTRRAFSLALGAGYVF